MHGQSRWRGEALEIDPPLAEAHAAIGGIHTRAGRWAQAEESFRRAISLQPELTYVYGSFALYRLAPVGKARRSAERDAGRGAAPIRFRSGPAVTLAGSKSAPVIMTTHWPTARACSRRIRRIRSPKRFVARA